MNMREISLPLIMNQLPSYTALVGATREKGTIWETNMRIRYQMNLREADIMG